ncbi:cilia- and flagella-associated protein 107 isoform X1 [Osmia lignaria lignaria]|uniref:cilia- and flagella-associated protein 107 isoform X1 n=1 Tax=Osmia lignaria lignaria TaxID=1437193 RepID=UPI00147877AD|nr:uncharacterized protein C1orf158-like isoform X1 [Osmia lignaria]XP_034176202.1 uncharacterized protein C1orf158-like isoform X1 [Osmia lignaria]
MDVMHWNLKQQCLGSSSSLTNVREKLDPKSKYDRAPVLSEDKYTPKTLVGNWFERRVVYTPEPDNWRTSYDVDYIVHTNKTWQTNQDAKWDNKLMLEGLARETLLDHREEYRNNMTTTYDLCYNILPKTLHGPRIRSYNARQRQWIPELDLTKSFGTLTEFGLGDMLKEEIYANSKEGIAKYRWQTTYREKFVPSKPLNTKENVKFRRRIVDFNVPDLKQFERKLADTKHCLFIR